MPAPRMARMRWERWRCAVKDARSEGGIRGIEGLRAALVGEGIRGVNGGTTRVL